MSAPVSGSCVLISRSCASSCLRDVMSTMIPWTNSSPVFRVSNQVAGVEHRALGAVGRLTTISNSRTEPSRSSSRSSSTRRLGSTNRSAARRRAKVDDRADAEHLQERGIRVEDLAVPRDDVYPLAQLPANSRRLSGSERLRKRAGLTALRFGFSMGKERT